MRVCSRRFVSIWTGSRWRLNWRQRGSGSCPHKPYWPDSRSDSRCSPVEHAPCQQTPNAAQHTPVELRSAGRPGAMALPAAFGVCGGMAVRGSRGSVFCSAGWHLVRPGWHGLTAGQESAAARRARRRGTAPADARDRARVWAGVLAHVWRGPGNPTSPCVILPGACGAGRTPSQRGHSSFSG